MNLLTLSQLDIALILGAVIFIVLGCVVFFICGIYRVKKGHAIIIEKARGFYCVHKQGIYFHMPIAYQRVASYIIDPLVNRYVARNGNALDITYQIEDVQKFYYSGQTFETIMIRIEKENSDVTTAVLTDTFNKYGLHFINVTKAK